MNESLLPIISPSILGLKPEELKKFLEEIALLEVELVHLDVVEAGFVNRPVESTEVEDFCSLSLLANEINGLRLDIHLMVEDPRVWLKHIDSKIRPRLKWEPYISFHPEAILSSSAKRLIAEIRESGSFPGLAIKPETPIHLLEECFEAGNPPELIIIMTVNPGISGQKMIIGCLDKVKALSGLPRPDGPLIEVDGGINLETAGLAVESGAEILVSGGFVQKDPSRIHLLRQLGNKINSTKKEL